MTTARQSAERVREEALTWLRETLKAGDAIYTILRHVSRSGMQREISLKYVAAGGAPIDITYKAATALGDRIGKRDGIVIGGAVRPHHGNAHSHSQALAHRMGRAASKAASVQVQAHDVVRDQREMAMSTTWSMFSPEVHELRTLLRTDATGRFGRADNYKRQALVELSRRLNLEDDIAHLRRIVDRAVDLCEALQGSQLDSWAATCYAKLDNALTRREDVAR